MTKKIMRSAIDAGFRWTAAHRKLREVVERERHWDGAQFSYGYAVNMFASAAQYREFWQRVWNGDTRMHLTPLGTYFTFQINSGSVDWTGAYLRSDGTTGKFRGRHNYPLYCIGCGRADYRLAEEYACDERITIPAELLIRIPKRPTHIRPEDEQRADVAWREKVRHAEQARAAKPPPIVEPPPLPAPAPRPQPVRVRPVKPSGALEGAVLSVLSSMWGTFKFLLLICLIAFAAARL